MGEPKLVVRNACFCDGITNVDPACPECAGTGNDYRTPTTADHIADLVALPPAERVARLVALLRACPDEAAPAVDTCKVAVEGSFTFRALNGPDHLLVDMTWSQMLDRACVRMWTPDHSEHWFPSDGGDEVEALAFARAALLADGWVLAGRVTP